MNWYKEIGFKDNPFTIKPEAQYDEFVDKINLRKVSTLVKNSKNVLIRGKYGVGKTSLVKNIIRDFKGQKKLFYFNAYSSDELDVEEVLKNAGNFFSRLFKLKTKNLVLVIDEAHNLKKEDFEEILEHKDWIKSVVLITSKSRAKFDSRFKLNEIKLEMFSLNKSFEIVEDRLNSQKNFLPKKVVKEIYKNSSSPRDFLMNCELACKKAYEKGANKVSLSHL